MNPMSLFRPVGLSKPVSQAAQDDLKDCIDSWKKGESCEPKGFLGDTDIRKRNWETVGPHFKAYFIRWASLVLASVHGYCHWKYVQFLAGKKVWK